MKKTTLLLTLLLTVALVGALVLVRQNQQLNRGATFANTTLSILPASLRETTVGSQLPVQVEFQTESGAKVDGVQADVCYGNNLSLDPDTGVTAGSSAGFSGNPIVVISSNSAIGESCAVIAVTSQQKADNLLTTGSAFTLNFTAVSAGSGSITLDQTKSMVTGDNPASATDKTIAITAVAGTTYQIDPGNGTTPTPTPSYPPNLTTGPQLKFKFTFAGVTPASQCAVSWPLKVIVLGGGQSVVATNIIPTATSDTATGANLTVYTASVYLGTALPTSNLALFVKGPKHLQMKLAKDGQSGPYGAAGGTLCVTASGCPDTYDFTNYPLLPGDVNQDGWINAADFSLVKTDASKYSQVDAGGNLQNDLDGSCQVNTRDETLLVNSLNAKQEELY